MTGCVWISRDNVHHLQSGTGQLSRLRNPIVQSCPAAPYITPSMDTHHCPKAPHCCLYKCQSSRRPFLTTSPTGPYRRRRNGHPIGEPRLAGPTVLSQARLSAPVTYPLRDFIHRHTLPLPGDSSRACLPSTHYMISCTGTDLPGACMTKLTCTRAGTAPCPCAVIRARLACPLLSSTH